MLHRYLGFVVTSMIELYIVSAERSSKLRVFPRPAFSVCFMLSGWSPKMGMPRTGTPRSIDSVVLRSPPWVMNNFRLGCAGKQERMSSFIQWQSQGFLLCTKSKFCWLSVDSSIFRRFSQIFVNFLWRLALFRFFSYSLFSLTVILPVFCRIFSFYSPRISDCGNHLLIFTFFGRLGSSASNFHSTL